MFEATRECVQSGEGGNLRESLSLWALVEREVRFCINMLHEYLLFFVSSVSWLWSRLGLKVSSKIPILTIRNLRKIGIQYQVHLWWCQVVILMEKES